MGAVSTGVTMVLPGEGTSATLRTADLSTGLSLRTETELIAAVFLWWQRTGPGKHEGEVTRIW